MWMYKFSENNGGTYLYTVGFYAPNGEFHTDSDGSKEECAERVHYLNGGNSPDISLVQGALMIAQGIASSPDGASFTVCSISESSVAIAKAVIEEANK